MCKVTHLPYKSWCLKAVPDQHRSLPEGVREYPTISFDMSYTGYDCTNEPADSEKYKLACLIVHCSHTDAIAAVPLPDKSAPSMKHAAVEVVRFCQRQRAIHVAASGLSFECSQAVGF